MTATIHHGDCLDALRNMPDNSVDAICCDPPYGLSNTSPDKVTETIVRWAQGDREYVPTGKGFMSQTWDAFVPPVAVWDECLRVLKPGGHLVAFAGSRTQDLMGLAIRLAGFDIRENLAWLYGSGFPKSMDVSKAIDKAAGAEREVIGFGPDHAKRAAAAGRGGTVSRSGGDAPVGQILTAPATPEAVRWQGYGTALKPAHEPIILARKPLSEGTVAANTLTWGTGGLNIDATRIESGGEKLGGGRNKAQQKSPLDGWNRPWMDDPDHVAREAERSREATAKAEQLGRWPANVVLDPDTAKALDQQSGTLKSGAYKPHYQQTAPKGTGVTHGNMDTVPGTPREASEGGASRFFKVVEPDPPFMYAAKAPKRERPRYEDADGNVIQHPTCKPLSIMKWLIRLTCPEGGTVLDPFAGSGTTVEAAILEGFNVIGIEREEAYLPLIQQRIDRASDQLPLAS